MQSEVNQEENLNRIITVPNLLSFFRLCLLGAEKNPGRYVAHYHQRLCGIFLYNRKVRHLLREIPKHVEDKKTDFLTELLPWSKSLPEHIGKLRQQ